jgi:streptogramin lyase
VIVSTFAGSGASGSANGTGTAASFNHPFGVAVDGSGNVYVADSTNDTVRKITSAGVVSTFAGQTGVTGTANGTGTAASFNYPVGVAIDGSGNVYMTDFTNEVIRKITSAGVVSTFAGQAGVSGSANGTGTAASFKGPSGIAVDASGNVYVGDQLNCTVRKITPAGVVSTLAGQAGVTGSANGIGTAATFNSPFGVVVDGSGNVYVADYYNYMIRKITSAGVVSTLAGQAGVTGSANGTGTAATFNDPNDVLLDGSGNVYVSDQLNGTIRKIHSRPIAANTAA